MINIKINSSLDERKSDRIYPDFIDFFISKLLRDSDMTHYPWGINGVYADHHLMYPAVVFKVPTDKIEDLYNEMKDNVPDIEKIFNLEGFKKFTHNFRLTIAPYNAAQGKAGGTMGHDGNMSVFVRTWHANGIPYAKPTDNNIQDQASKSIMHHKKTYIPQVLDTLTNVIYHEFAHYINAFRSSKKTGNPVVHRAKGGNQQFYTHTPEYANSTEEIQARLVDFTNAIRSAIKKHKAGDIVVGEERGLITALSFRNPRTFIEKGLKHWASLLGYFNDKITPEIRRKIINRLSGIYDEYHEDMVKYAKLRPMPPLPLIPKPPPPPPQSKIENPDSKPKGDSDKSFDVDNLEEENIADYYGGSDIDMRIPDRKVGEQIPTSTPYNIRQPMVVHMRPEKIEQDYTLDEDLLFEELIYEKKDRCYHLAKQKYDVFPSAYASGFIVRCRKGKVGKRKKKVNEELEEVIEIDEGTFDKEKSQGLHGWFARKGGKGKSKGWVDCNTCRTNPKTGRKTCQTCGRTSGEKRSKYPACRPTPSACTKAGTSRKKSSMRVSWKSKKRD